jgi:hypothetical protein
MSKTVYIEGKVQGDRIVFEPAIERTLVYGGRDHKTMVRSIPIDYARKYEQLENISDGESVRINADTLHRAIRGAYHAKRKLRENERTNFLNGSGFSDLDDDEDRVSDEEIAKLFEKKEREEL